VKRIDLTGQKIGRITVIKLDYVKHSKNPISKISQAKVYWECICECGNMCTKTTDGLRHTLYPSCGCWVKERLSIRSAKENYKHGLSHDRLYRLVNAAKSRAKRTGKEFDLVLEDIHLPHACPILGIEIEWGEGRSIDGSPSLDRFDNTKGYTKDNVRVISRRANCLKNDATLGEMERIVSYMKGEL